MQMLRILLCSMQSLVILFMRRVEKVFGLAMECISVALACIVVIATAIVVALSCTVAKVNDKLIKK